MSQLHVMGVRHHGPGSARSLLAALEALRPDCLLLEAPADAQPLVPLAADPQLRPPVAMLVYPPDAPRRAVFYPLAEFSPEWQALRFALSQSIEVRFMDLPQAMRLAQEDRGETGPTDADDSNDSSEEPPASPAAASGPGSDVREDPLGALARAAGYDDRELWWEQQVEQRHDAGGLFDAVLEAMQALREASGPMPPEEQRREAFMRQTIRQAQRDGFERIAVVCGAWHAPVLHTMPREADDRAALRGLKKIKTAAAWIPWTYSRLSYRSGYGAGIGSPGWYDALWRRGLEAGTYFVARAAQLLRTADLDAPTASVIEVVRLAEATAALRGLPAAGLREWNEALQAALCGGRNEPMALVRQQLEVGQVQGTVPSTAPTVPLQRDLETQQRRLRLKPVEEEKALELDLRKAIDLDRSRLLHRLRILGIEWGRPQDTRGALGTFRESWQLAWQAEFAVTIIEAAVWGGDVASAAAAKLTHDAQQTTEVAQLAGWLDAAVLADLPDATRQVLRRLQDTAAVAADATMLMPAMPPLARVARYGDVRQTAAGDVLPILRGLYERILVGLPGACASLDDEAAAEMLVRLDALGEALAICGPQLDIEEWYDLLGRLADTAALHGLLRGYVCRLLYDARRLDDTALARRAAFALSGAAAPAQAGAWVEGLLRGSAAALLHHEDFWRVLDGWLTSLTGETFEELLPLLRRAFSNFPPPQRRRMAEKVRHLSAPAPSAPDAAYPVNEARARQVLPVLALVLGGTPR